MSTPSRAHSMQSASCSVDLHQSASDLRSSAVVGRAIRRTGASFRRWSCPCCGPVDRIGNQYLRLQLNNWRVQVPAQYVYYTVYHINRSFGRHRTQVPPILHFGARELFWSKYPAMSCMIMSACATKFSTCTQDPQLVRGFRDEIISVPGRY